MPIVGRSNRLEMGHNARSMSSGLDSRRHGTVQPNIAAVSANTTAMAAAADTTATANASDSTCGKPYDGVAITCDCWFESVADGGHSSRLLKDSALVGSIDRQRGFSE